MCLLCDTLFLYLIGLTVTFALIMSTSALQEQARENARLSDTIAKLKDDIEHLQLRLSTASATSPSADVANSSFASSHRSSHHDGESSFRYNNQEEVEDQSFASNHSSSKGDRGADLNASVGSARSQQHGQEASFAESDDSTTF
jgi:hypothetical protein